METLFNVVVLVIGGLLCVIGFFISLKLNDIKEKHIEQDKKINSSADKIERLETEQDKKINSSADKIARLEEKFIANIAHDAHYMIMFEKLLDAKLLPIARDIEYLKKHLK